MTMVKKELLVELSAEERESYELKAGKHGIALANLEAKREELAALAKTEKTELAKIAKALREGGELRMVECDEVQVFETNEVRTIRRDTGAVVEQRAMRADERQEQMFAEPTGGKKKRRGSPVPDEPPPIVEEADGGAPKVQQ